MNVCFKKLVLPIVGVSVAISAMIAGCAMRNSEFGLGGLADLAAQPEPVNKLSELEEFWLAEYADAEGSAEKMKVYTITMLAKAQPDECFAGIGEPYPPGPPCVEGQAKVNQAYVWGLAKWGSTLWFGTAPNVHCLVFGAFLGNTGPTQTRSYVCEFGESQIVQNNPMIPAMIGDWRPSDIFVYDLNTRTLTKLNHLLTGLHLMRLQTTIGLRSAGAHDGVVLFGGPSMAGGINIFAFNAMDGSFLGSANLPYSNIRKWILVDGVLYTGVGPTQNSAFGGYVLRWNGDLANPFVFEVVGRLDSDAAELAEHNGKLFVSTWPSATFSGSGNLAGLWMSPPIPINGLTESDADNWQKVWQVDEYEPDPVTAAVYGGGALASFDGYLYWGTMHVPFTGALANFGVYGTPSDPKQAIAVALGTHRAISIFRGKFDDNNDEVQLLYGTVKLPVYNPQKGKFDFVPNKTGIPLYGKSGFGNFFNNYTWTMDVYKNQLFIGTMDWSYLAADGLMTAFLEQTTGLTIFDLIHLPRFNFGADLYTFRSAQKRATWVNTDGVGNYTNYGIRTMLSGLKGLYLGTANPMNLLTNPHDNILQGGWELIKMDIEEWD